MSPDSKLKAVVTPAYSQERGFDEHLVELQTMTGKRLFRNNYASTDHEHGWGIRYAGWTPDSRYFVYSASSSGGRSAWHFPTCVYVRDLGRVFSIDDMVGSLVSPLFVLSPPCKFHSGRINPLGQERGTDEQPIPVDVDLSTLSWK